VILVTTKIDVERFSKQKEMVQTVDALVERVRQEPGCLSSELYQDPNKDNALCLLEEWRPRRIWTRT